MKYGAIILAAGQGLRFGCQKQFIKFQNKELWKIVKDKVIRVIGNENIITVGVDVIGGETRSESVRIGLSRIDEDTDKVIILEAARPLVTEEQIKELLECDKPSVSFVMPLVNTVIYRNGDYINRNDLYELLTPQAFDYMLLKKAYADNPKIDATDDTRVVFEFSKIKPFFIETKQNLVKVTYKKDIEIIEQIYKLMEKGEM